MPVFPVTLELYERLSDKIGTDTASLLIQFIEEAVEKRAVTTEEFLSEIHRLDKQITETRQELIELIREVEQRLNKRIDEVEQNLSKRIDEVEQRLNKRIDEVEQRLNKRIDEVEQRLNKRIDEVEQRLNKRIDELEHKFELRFISLEHSVKSQINRTFYILLLVIIVLNGDKIASFFNTLLGLFK